MSRPLIMLVDDDDDIRETATLVFDAAGYDVVTAIDGVDALEKLEVEPMPAVIVLDWMMPRMDGEQFLEILSTGANAEVPVIVLTGHVRTHRASELGARAIITKPPELDVLLGAVEKLTKRESEPSRGGS
jgi:chemosensory pili system protein ChpA (sensor histidine kinase/response regulator)